MRNRIVSTVIIFLLFASTFYNLCYAETEDIKNKANKEEVIETGLLENNEIMKVPNQVATIASGDDEWTDMSNAEWEITKNNKSVTFTLGDFERKDNHYYSVALTKDDSIPDVSQLTENDMHRLTYNDSTLKFEDLNFASLYERNLSYICIIEENISSEKQVVAYGEQLKRVEEPKYFEAFDSTSFFTSTGVQVSMNFSHEQNLRKEQIKVGKITDINILQSLKNSNTSGWESLMEYAKEDSTSLYNDTVDLDSYGLYSTEQDVIGKNKVEDGQYYYLYVKTDDESGKYISNEAVTISKASKYPDGSYFMFFYGSNKFEWNDFDVDSNNGNGGVSSSKPKDTTTSPLMLPRTGITAITVATLLVLISTGAISYYKVKKYKGIK